MQSWQKSCVIHDGDYGMMDLAHYPPRLAGVRIVAIRAGMSLPFADAWKCNQRTIDQADDRAYGDSFRWDSELIAAVRSAATRKHAGILKIQQNRLKKACGRMGVFRNPVNENGTAAILARQEVESAQSVLALS
jgi:hypothetical protein